MEGGVCFQIIGKYNANTYKTEMFDDNSTMPTSS